MGGGVAIYVENNLKLRVREDLITDFESISIELEIKYVKPIVVTTVYRPPGSCVELFHKIETELITKIDAENKKCIFTGDMNCDMLKPRDNDNKNLKRIYNNYHFKQLITEPTRVTSDTSTIIDHISTNKPDRVLTSGIIPCGISDHDAVFSVRGLRLPKFRRTSKNVTVRKFKKFDLSSFRSSLSKINFNSIKLITSDPNQIWFLWKTMFLDVLNKHAPVDSIKIIGNNLPNITSEVRQMARQRDFLRKKANQTGSKYLRQAFQHVKKRVTYKVRKLRSEYYLKKIKENEGDLKGT